MHSARNMYMMNQEEQMAPGGRPMGLSVVAMEVGNPAEPDVTEAIELLVDSGAIYSVVPGAVLERLGIKRLSQQEFRLADGTKITRQKGIALFKYGERIGGADVIFGEPGDSDQDLCPAEPAARRLRGPVRLGGTLGGGGDGLHGPCLPTAPGRLLRAR